MKTKFSPPLSIITTGLLISASLMVGCSNSAPPGLKKAEAPGILMHDQTESALPSPNVLINVDDAPTEQSKTKPSTQTNPTSKYLLLSWARSGGGQKKFTVTALSDTEFTFHVTEYNFKAVDQYISLKQSSNKELFASVNGIMNGGTVLSEEQGNSDAPTGTWLKILLETPQGEKTEFNRPEIKSDQELLQKIEQFVIDSMGGTETNTNTGTDTTTSNETNCETLDLIGTWSYHDESIGCGWAGTVMEIKSATFPDRGDYFEGTDKVYSGGFIAQPPKEFKTKYTLHRSSCILDKDVEGKTKSYSLRQPSLKQLILTECEDSHCEKPLLVDGKPVEIKIKKDIQLD